jgi:hypothetical protein
MPIRDSIAETTITLAISPAEVADAVQTVLNNVKRGKIKTVSRETGVIIGSINAGTLTFTISKIDEGTKLAIHSRYGEGIGTSGGAAKRLAEFIATFSALPNIKGTNSGW